MALLSSSAFVSNQSAFQLKNNNSEHSCGVTVRLSVHPAAVTAAQGIARNVARADNSSRPLRVLKQSRETVHLTSSLRNDDDNEPVPAAHSEDQLAAAVAVPIQGQGLGIVQFLKNKKLLVAGGTGFLGKVLVQKILQEQPEVGRIYLLINADSQKTAQHRLLNDVLESELFRPLKQQYGPLYSKFMLEKLVALPGKIDKADLGLKDEAKRMISQEVDIVVNSAATTNFFERYDVALNINTKGPLNLLEFARSCPRLQLFLHVSTAYVNGTREGRVMEAPLTLGQSIARERFGDEAAPSLDVWEEIGSAEKSLNISDQKMKELGMQRARVHGWQDTYVFTKAMGEMLVNEARGELPVVILRPSVVESTCEQPFGGWIQGTRMMDPIALGYGKGHVRGFYGDPDGVLDVIPADMVINSLLAAMTLHAGQPGLNVYQVGSSTVNPLTFSKLTSYMKDHFLADPFLDEERNRPIEPKGKLYDNKLAFSIHKFLNYGLPIQLARVSGNKRLQRYAKRSAFLAQRLDQLVQTYAAYTFYKGRFDISNTQTLYERLSQEEQKQFGFDIKSINWEDYIKNIHLPGLRKYNTAATNSSFRLITVKEYFQGLFAT